MEEQPLGNQAGTTFGLAPALRSGPRKPKMSFAKHGLICFGIMQFSMNFNLDVRHLYTQEDREHFFEPREGPGFRPFAVLSIQIGHPDQCRPAHPHLSRSDDDQ